MPVPLTGPISFKLDIVKEFPNNIPYSLSEFYGVDTPIPTSGQIKFSDFRGTSRTTLITYTIIGGGGAGGFGMNVTSSSKTSAASGGTTSISSTDIGTIFSIGGVGGINNGGSIGKPGTAGQDSTLGTGGLGGSTTAKGGDATGYGAGGGGGGGDTNQGWGDDYGANGLGGGAAVVATGTVSVHYGQIIDIIIGAGGVGSVVPNGKTPGGNGSVGYCKLVYDGKTYITTSSIKYMV